jgi:hypothetical protein
VQHEVAINTIKTTEDEFKKLNSTVGFNGWYYPAFPMSAWALVGQQSITSQMGWNAHHLHPKHLARTKVKNTENNRLQASQREK